MSKTKVTPAGRAGWSQLKEARGFKGAEENKKYSQDLILPKEVGEKFVAELQEEANKLHAQAIERARMSGKNVRYAPPMINYRDLPDGSIQLSFKRKEDDGQPIIVGEDNKPTQGFVNRDAQIQIAFEVVPYVLASTFGVTFKLEVVKILENKLSAASLNDIFGEPAPTKDASKPKPDLSDLF